MKIRIRRSGAGTIEGREGIDVTHSETNIILRADIDAIVEALAERDVTVAGLTVTGSTALAATTVNGDNLTLEQFDVCSGGSTTQVYFWKAP